MSEHHFGVGQGRPKFAARINRIALQSGAVFVHCKLPGEGWRYWFVCANLGHPFDAATEKAVVGDLRVRGLWPIPVHEH